tara:strand:- start:1426 stop:1716 length:291 start_codon:yes stop_codon:yes gene_type:complete
MNFHKMSGNRKRKIFKNRSLARCYRLVDRIGQSGKFGRISQHEKSDLAKELAEIVVSEITSDEFTQYAQKVTPPQKIDRKKTINNITEYIMKNAKT